MKFNELTIDAGQTQPALRSFISKSYQNMNYCFSII